MTKPLTQSYILGITEGREFLKSNPGMTNYDMRRCMENAQDLMRNHSEDMRQVFRGERDFWKNQIKIGKNKNV